MSLKHTFGMAAMLPAAVQPLSISAVPASAAFPPSPFPNRQGYGAMLAVMDYATLIQQFGVMGAILVGVLIAVWRAIRWIGHAILQPLVARHVAFLEKIETLQVKQSLVIEEIAHAQTRQTALLNQLQINYEAGNKLLETLINSRNDILQQVLEHCREIVRRLEMRGI